jgi:hypothetical protein
MPDTSSLWIILGLLVALAAFFGILIMWLASQVNDENTWRAIQVNIYNRTGDFPLSEWIECADTGAVYHVIVYNPKNMPTRDIAKAIRRQAKKDGFKIKAIGIRGIASA